MASMQVLLCTAVARKHRVEVVGTLHGVACMSEHVAFSAATTIATFPISDAQTG
jgi:hypothetical protein